MIRYDRLTHGTQSIQSLDLGYGTQSIRSLDLGYGDERLPLEIESIIKPRIGLSRRIG
jgi:hypothetical protein